MRLEVGTKIIATDPCIMDNRGTAALTVGNTYEILSINKFEFVIHDDQADLHIFAANEFDEFFMIPGEDRLLCLRKLGRILPKLRRMVIPRDET